MSSGARRAAWNASTTNDEQAPDRPDHGDVALTTPTFHSDRYSLTGRLGSGGMADVFRARDRVLSRDVAIKVLRHATVEPGDHARFVGEARTLAALSHRNLVTVLDAALTDQHPFLVMELVEGATLAAASSHGALPLREVAEIGIQAADALSYAHAHGVVHRDVKPANILLGTDGRVRLADFGIARLIGDTARHTQTGQAIGTAAYLAPEQVTGGELTGAMDVYSLGLVLLEAATGTRAYPGTATEAALARLHRGPDVPASLPRSWRLLITAMTSLEPGARPSADDVARTLRNLATEHSSPPVVEAPTAVLQQHTQTRHLAAPEPPPGHDAWAGARAAWSRTSGSTRALVGVAAVLLFLLVAVAVVAGTDTPDDRLPDNTPTRLRGPLGELHDAVLEE